MDQNINHNIIENSYYMINLFSNDKNKEKNISITNLKLQKLMYFVEAYYMVKNPNEEFFFDTSWSAWDYGPVNRDLYNHYKKFGSMEILLTEEEIDIGNNLSKNNKKYIDEIYSLFGGFSAFELVTLTHLENSPWSIIKESKNYDFESLNNSIISKEETMKWFKKRFDFLFTENQKED